MEECDYCVEKEKKHQQYLEEIEKEKIRECQSSLEREKIAKGMLSTKADERRLKQDQKMQIEEKKSIEQQHHEIDMMWHEVLLADCHRKEQQEQFEAIRKQLETRERRKCYDEQIASANKQRQEALRQERAKENRKLEKMKLKMEQDHYEEIKQKKEQQMCNRKNFIEGHELKLARLREEKMKARAIDEETIRVALEELRRENERNRIQMKNLQLVKQCCIENYNRERKMASALEEEAEKVTNEWRDEEQSRADERAREMERQKQANKEKAIESYKIHLENRNLEMERSKLERSDRMELVKRAAFNELYRRIDDTNAELKKQVDYRNTLTRQIRENEKHWESHQDNTENKDRTFTRKATMFRDIMAERYASSSSRTSTNPVHPFMKAMETEKFKDKKKHLHLPSIK